MIQMYLAKGFYEIPRAQLLSHNHSSNKNCLNYTDDDQFFNPVKQLKTATTTKAATFGVCIWKWDLGHRIFVLTKTPLGLTEFTVTS